MFTPEVHDSWYVRESDENAAEDEDGGLEVGQEEDGCKVDGHDREAHVPVKLASNDLEMGFIWWTTVGTHKKLWIANSLVKMLLNFRKSS